MNIFSNKTAFSPFFTESVVFEGVRPGGRKVRATVNACVLDESIADPLTDSAVDSIVRAVSIEFMAEEWPEVSGRPQAGDAVKVESGVVYKVYSVSGEADTFTVKAREVPK